mgnify:FL=1
MSIDRKLPVYLFFLLVLVILLFQSFHPSWFAQSSTDVYVYSSRASYFLSHFNLTELDYNEYLPGAVLFFISVIPTLLISNRFEPYLLGFMTVNVVLLFIIAYIYQKFGKIENVAVFSLILLFTGPIIFFRFELLVVLLVLLSFYFWSKHRYIKSAIFLGLGTLVKLYPILFLPYFLILKYKTDRIKGVLQFGLVYILTVIILTIFYLLIFKVPFANLQQSLNFHSMKPVNTESIWADILTFTSTLTTGHFPTMISAWGINGLDPKFWFLPLWFYNWIWVLPIGLMYLWFIFKIRKKEAKFDNKFCIAIILLFLIFSKVLPHQYLLWFMLLIPLIDIKILISREWTINLFIVLITTFIHQYIYPLNYSQFLSGFSNPTEAMHLFTINRIAHILLIVLFIRLMFEIKKDYR